MKKMKRKFPEIRDYKLIFSDSMPWSMFGRVYGETVGPAYPGSKFIEKKIKINSENKYEGVTLFTLLHEIRHAIQFECFGLSAVEYHNDPIHFEQDADNWALQQISTRFKHLIDEKQLKAIQDFVILPSNEKGQRVLRTYV
jgi:hypothetical protein